MFRKFVIAVLLFAVLTGCKSKSAFNYSQSIVKKEKSMIPEMQSTEKKVVKFLTDRQFDSVAAAGVFMENLVQAKIDEIEALPVPRVKEADNFKKATMNYFRFIKSLYTDYRNLGNAKTEEERAEVVTDLQKLVDAKQSAINDMQSAQRKFADANGFKIQ